MNRWVSLCLALLRPLHGFLGESPHDDLDEFYEDLVEFFRKVIEFALENSSCSLSLWGFVGCLIEALICCDGEGSDFRLVSSVLSSNIGKEFAIGHVPSLFPPSSKRGVWN